MVYSKLRDAGVEERAGHSSHIPKIERSLFALATAVLTALVVEVEIVCAKLLLQRCRS